MKGGFDGSNPYILIKGGLDESSPYNQIPAFSKTI
jgi:hypothetical protein